MNHGIQRHSMPRRERTLVYAMFALLWLSGAGWLILDSCCTVAAEFGSSPHPWQPGLLLAHGVASIPALCGIGWISARHAAMNWGSSLRRNSGAVFGTVLVILCASGFALFFVTSVSAQRLSGLSHEVAGFVLTAIAVEHWRVIRYKP